MSFRTGDVILHKPSGERWLVAYERDGCVCCCGWPESLAKTEDCEMVRAATDDKHLRLLLEIARSDKMGSRSGYAVAELERRGIAWSDIVDRP